MVVFSTKTVFGFCIWFASAVSTFASSESNVDLWEADDALVLAEPCVAIVKEIMGLHDAVELQCSTPSEMIYNVPNVDVAWIRKESSSGALVSGVTMLGIPPQTLIDKRTQTLILDGPPTLLNDIDNSESHNRRHLAVTTGTKRVLVVRVIATDSTTTATESELASDIFGDDGDILNMKSQYYDCSFGKLQMEKTDDRVGATTNIQNGVVTISPGVATDGGELAMVNAISSMLAIEFSTPASNLADHIMYCLPPGTFYGLAYAYMNGFRSVYNDIWCSSPSVQMHELGHNLNMGKKFESIKPGQYTTRY
eukprot:scaffold4715_cov115-Cylindrotheca_fusiformis.AAC.11